MILSVIYVLLILIQYHNFDIFLKVDLILYFSNLLRFTARPVVPTVSSRLEWLDADQQNARLIWMVRSRNSRTLQSTRRTERKVGSVRYLSQSMQKCWRTLSSLVPTPSCDRHEAKLRAQVFRTTQVVLIYSMNSNGPTLVLLVLNELKVCGWT